MGINVITGEIVASYANVWKPKENQSGALKFSMCCLIPKTQKEDVALINKAIKAAFDEGVTKGFWPASAWSSPKFKKPLRDGDAEIKTGDKKPGIGYEGMMFFNCNKEGDPDNEYFEGPPEVTKALNGKVVPISDKSEFYSGCKCRVAVGFYPFNNKSKGVAVGLNAILKTADGARMDGRESAKSAFGEFAEGMENLEGDKASMTVVDGKESNGFD
jgi:hypothetical protein